MSGAVVDEVMSGIEQWNQVVGDAEYARPWSAEGRHDRFPAFAMTEYQYAVRPPRCQPVGVVAFLEFAVLAVKVERRLKREDRQTV